MKNDPERRLPLSVHRCARRAERVLAAASIRDEALVVAVSGGSDSMALLEVLGLVSPRLGLALHVAHIDHRVRDDTAAEAALVRAAAARWSAPFHGAAIDPGSGDEDTLRSARHAMLRTIAANAGARWIALGHTSDDQIETIVFRFLRGAGLGGLAGMRGLRPPFVRPLLGIRREELRVLLRDRGIDWVEDETNLSDRYARGRLRTRVLPAIASAFGTGATDHLLDVAPRWRADEEYLEAEAGRLLAYALRRGSELDVSALAESHPALRARALRRWLAETTGHTPASRELATVERWLDAQAEPGSSPASCLDIASARLRCVGGRVSVASQVHDNARGAPPDAVDIGPASDDAFERGDAERAKRR